MLAPVNRQFSLVFSVSPASNVDEPILKNVPKMTPKTGHEKPRQRRGEHLQAKKKRNEMIPEINANIFPKREPKSHDSAEDSIDNNDQPHPKINKKVTQNSFQMAPQRESQTALVSAISSLFFACVLRLVSRCPWEPSWKPPERSGGLWGGPGSPRKPPRGPRRPKIPFFLSSPLEKRARENEM